MATHSSRVLEPINEQKLYDSRTVFCPEMEDVTAHIEPGQNGDPVIPLDKVNELIVENEFLKEELFTKQNSIINSIYHKLRIECQYSKQQISHTVQEIVKLTKPILKEHDIWNFVISEFITLAEIKQMKSNETVLDFCWRHDLLPMVSVILVQLRFVLWSLERYSKTSFKHFMVNLKQGMNQPRHIIKPNLRTI